MSAAWTLAFVVQSLVLLAVAGLVLGLVRRLGDTLDRVQFQLSAPELGAPIGSTVSRFELDTADGATTPTPFESRALYLFLRAGCAACEPVVASLGANAEQINGVALLIVLREPNEVAELGVPASARVLLDTTGAAGTAFENRATPQAYLVIDDRIVDRRLIASRDDLVAMVEGAREREEVDAATHNEVPGVPEQVELRPGRSLRPQADGALRR